MWSLDHFGEATDQQLLLWTDPCSGATLAYNAALKSHWMETFIFKYWPQSWGRCEFSRQCPALAVCAGTGELYWENKEEFVCGSLYKTTKLESLCTLPMKIFSCLTTNRDSLKKKNQHLRFLLNDAWFRVWLLHVFGQLCESPFKVGAWTSRKPRLTISQCMPWIREMAKELRKGINTICPVLLVCLSGRKSLLPLTA